MLRVFRSRWVALLWAAGICWTAVDFASGQSATPGNAATLTDATGAPVDAAALAALANAAP